MQDRVYAKLRMFTTGRFPFKYGPLCLWHVVLRYCATTGQEVPPDNMVTVYDKLGSLSDKP